MAGRVVRCPCSGYISKELPSLRPGGPRRFVCDNCACLAGWHYAGEGKKRTLRRKLGLSPCGNAAAPPKMDGLE